MRVASNPDEQECWDLLGCLVVQEGSDYYLEVQEYTTYVPSNLNPTISHFLLYKYQYYR